LRLNIRLNTFFEAEKNRGFLSVIPENQIAVLEARRRGKSGPVLSRRTDAKIV
jgi:hypothetical protein